MITTEYHIRVLRYMAQTPFTNVNKLAPKMHPDQVGVSERSAKARVTRAINELEHANMVECVNPDVRSWAITDRGRAEITVT